MDSCMICDLPLVTYLIHHSQTYETCKTDQHSVYLLTWQMCEIINAPTVLQMNQHHISCITESNMNSLYICCAY